MENDFKQEGRVGDFAVHTIGNEINVARIVKVTDYGYTVRHLTAPADESIKVEDDCRLEWWVDLLRTFIIPIEAQEMIAYLDPRPSDQETA